MNKIFNSTNKNMKTQNFLEMFFLILVIFIAQITTKSLTKKKINSSKKLLGKTKLNTATNQDVEISSITTASRTPSKTLYDCTNVTKGSLLFHIKATCIKNNGTSYTGSLDLNDCFGNGHGQLKKGVNFSNSCTDDTFRVLTRIVQQQNSFSRGDGTYGTDYYETQLDGPYYLNGKCKKGDGNGNGFSYINMYSVIKITDGVMGC